MLVCACCVVASGAPGARHARSPRRTGGACCVVAITTAGEVTRRTGGLEEGEVARCTGGLDEGEVARCTGGLGEATGVPRDVIRRGAAGPSDDLGDMISTFLMARTKVSADASSL